MSYQRRKYKLINLDNGTEITLNGDGSNNEPKNWDISDFTFKRAKDLSFTIESSKDLEFTGNGAKFLRDAYLIRDVEANVKMIEIRFNPNTDVAYNYLTASFNFASYQDLGTYIKIPFLEGDLKQLIKTKGKDKFELNRVTSIEGDTIEPLELDKFACVSRPLYLDSLLKTGEEDSFSNRFRSRWGDDYHYAFLGFPLDLSYESDDRVTSIIPDQLTQVAANSPVDTDLMGGLSAYMFYNNNDILKTINIDFEVSFTAKFIRDDNLSIPHLSFGLMKFTGGDAPVAINSYLPVADNGYEVLIDLTEVVTGNLTKSYTYSLNRDITLNAGESLSLGFYGGGDYDVFIGAAVLDIDFLDMIGSLRVIENSFRNDLNRTFDFALNRNVGESCMRILTGQEGRYVSEFFSNSHFKNTGLSSGKMIRGFEDSTISTSLKEFLDNSRDVYGMGYNIELVEGVEKLVHEPLTHFFRSESVIKIPEQVNNVKRTVAKDFIYSTINTGYKKPSGDNLYEEVNGLNEFNTSNEYITPITRIDDTFDITSPYRADSEGKELTVRQSIELNPTGDYRTDDNIFNLDLKDIGTGIYEERTWTDDFVKEPTGVFSPSTLTGLRITPFRNMKRLFWFINAGLSKFQSKFIRYASSRGNSDLSTELISEDEYAENGNYKISEIDPPLFLSQFIEFEYPLDFDLLTAVNGSTFVNGRSIPNIYFKIEFINEFKEKEYGYLFQLKPKGVGKWKVLKAV